MARILITAQASAEFNGLPPLERDRARHTLGRLAKGEVLGIKLWGQDDVLALEMPRGERFLYRLSGDDIQVLGIEPSHFFHTPFSRLKLAAVVLAGGYIPDHNAISLKKLIDSFLTAGIDDVVIVANHSYDNASQELKYHNVTLVTSAERDNCLAHSLRRGLRLLTSNTRAVFLSLGNRPFITPNIVTSVIRTFKTRPSPIVVPVHEQMRGHPVLFDACLLPELMRARGNVGGRAVLAHHNNELTQIEIPDAGFLERVWVN
jgi:molybdenum cofactor cytidylyltransferase